MGIDWMRLVLAALVSLCAVVGTHALQPLPCSFTVGDKYYDLTPLFNYQYGNGGKGDLMLQDMSPSSGYAYYVAFCSIVQYAQSPAAKYVSFLQAKIDQSGGPWMIASWKEATPTATALPGNADGLILTTNNGDSCTNPRSSIITLTCSPGGPLVPATLPKVTAGGNCQYLVTMASSAACATKPAPPGGGGGGPHKISGGTIFLIILLVTTFLYIVLGCFYKTKYKGTTGRESCPNFTFWSTLPGLVKDGFVFTWTKLRGLCRRGGGEGYETVK